MGVDFTTEPPEELVDGVLEGGCPREQRLEEHEHHQEEDDRSPHRVQQHLVNALGSGVRVGVLVADAGQDGIDPAGQFLGVGGRQDGGTAPGLPLADEVAQFPDADATIGDHGHHRHAQCLGQGGGVEAAATASQLVSHGDDDGGGQIALQSFGEEQQRAPQCRRVGHDEDAVGRLHAFEGGVQGFGDNGLVRGDGVEGIGAGEVLDAVFNVADPADAGSASDGDPGVVASFGVQAGELVEDRRLAAIG